MTYALEALPYPFKGAHRGDAIGAAWALVLAHGFVPVVPLLPVVGIVLRVLAGSAIVDAEAVDRGEYGEITERARAIVEAVESAR